MKKPLLIAIAGFALVLAPAPARAELQCFTGPSYTSYLSVQNRTQCASESSGALFDTATQSWQDPATGNAIYDPKYTCVGLAPAYRTSTPTAEGGCTAGYKLGQITKDPSGNISKIQYQDGSVETPNRDPYGNVTGTAYVPAANTATLPSGVGRNPNAFCTGGSCTYVPLEPLPGLPSQYGPGQGSIQSWIGQGFTLLIGAGALVAIIMIVLGALTYMFSDIAGNKKNALARIRNAMWAIVILVSSYLILYTINPDLLTFNLNIKTSGNFNTAPNSTGSTAQTQAQQASAQPQAQLAPDQINTCLAGGGYYTQVSGNWACLPTTAL